jgi:hypothetical protein
MSRLSNPTVHLLQRRLETRSKSRERNKLKMMKALALSEEGMPPTASDQARTDCNLTALIGPGVDVVSVACIINDCNNANLLALAIGVEMKAMASHPRQKNCVEI